MPMIFLKKYVVNPHLFSGIAQFKDNKPIPDEVFVSVQSWTNLFQIFSLSWPFHRNFFPLSILKINGVKTRHLDHNINDPKSYIWDSGFGIFGHITILNLSRSSSGQYQNFFFNFRFSSRTSQREQKLAKKITHFTIQLLSKNLTHFKKLNSLDIENNMLLQHSQKSF